MFADQVRPILEQKCLRCHNDQDRKGGLSLETRAALLSGGDSGEAIVPGAPGESLLMDLIEPYEQKADMPQGLPPLTDQEIAAIRRWIASGAPWPANFRLSLPRWWSLKPLRRPAIPRPRPVSHFPLRTPIDAFILARLQSKGLVPAPPADRRTLARRLYFDLWGLPPTPEQIEQFVNDPDPLAYEQLVDRLLASPHYGERWARHWLDVVKYADTCGYDKDKLRPNAWPYRDYVIRSFNEDKPYARFVQEQLAGDVLFPGSPDGILGLGFIAAGPWDFIGHVEVPESKQDGKVARNLDRDEMVSNTLNTFCSVTIQCARCHDHKFDPFTQEHYYSLQAVFAAVDRAERPYDTDPSIETKRRTLTNQLAALQTELQQLEQEISDDGGDELVQLDRQIADLSRKAGSATKRPEFGYHSQIVKDPRTEKWVTVDLGQEYPIDKIVLHPCHDDYANIGAGFGFPVRYRIETAVSNGAAPDQFETVVDRTSADVANPGLTPVECPLHGRMVRKIRITATRLVERKNDYIFALAELEAISSDGKNVALGAQVTSLDSIEAPVRWRRTNLTDGIFAQATDPEASRKLAELKQQRQTLWNKINTPERAARRSQLDQEIKTTQAQLDRLPVGRMVYAAATHFKPQGQFRPTKGVPREIRILNRGKVNDPGALVSPGTIPILSDAPWQFDLPEGHTEGDRRAALARWITRKSHPLTWRSIVNRIWLGHFGHGLVDSPNDFGRMGRLPSHPHLLDWLATEFRDQGQSFKHLHRLIVTSSVYRQSARHHPENALIDSGNQFLWKMPRRRLSAEEVRDATLMVSGQMQYQMGGPGFYLFQLEKTEHSPHYEYHKFDPSDPASHRRSIYRFIVRSQPDPYMTTLDCADSSQSTPKRNETITALQALTLMNNRFQLVMAENLAERLASEADSLSARIQLGMRLVTGHPPTREQQLLLEAYARKHGLENLCRVLLNLSEFVFVD